MGRQSLGAMGSVVSIAILLLLVQPVAAVTPYSITVGTDASAYVGAHPVKVTSSVTPAPGPNTAVFVKVISPNRTLVDVGNVVVNATSGAFEFDFVAGGSTAWVTGTYKVNATWGAYPPTISTVATFTWAPTVVTTTTTTSTTHPTTTSTTTSSSTTSSSTSTSSSTTSSSSTAPPTTSTTSSSSTSTSSSTTTTPSAGEILEFPIESPLVALALSVMIAALYFYVRQGARKKLR